MLTRTGCAYIFANGTRMNAEVIASLLAPGDYYIAADGGYRFMQQLGVQPHLVIGDLDSLTSTDIAEIKSRGIEVRQYPIHKDETDLELALEAAIEAGYRQIRIVAALGGRLDMTLGNIFLLMLPALADLDVRLEDGYDEVSLIRPTGLAGFAIHGLPSELISLLPLGGPAQGIRTEALQYPLHEETLYPERTRGISNVMTAETAAVHLRSGLLICIHTHQLS